MERVVGLKLRDEQGDWEKLLKEDSLLKLDMGYEA